jgi:hypothetical protein
MMVQLGPRHPQVVFEKKNDWSGIVGRMLCYYLIASLIDMEDGEGRDVIVDLPERGPRIRSQVPACSDIPKGGSHRFQGGPTQATRTHPRKS